MKVPRGWDLRIRVKRLRLDFPSGVPQYESRENAGCCQAASSLYATLRMPTYSCGHSQPVTLSRLRGQRRRPGLSFLRNCIFSDHLHAFSGQDALGDGLPSDRSSDAPGSLQKRFTLGVNSLGLSEHLSPVFKRLQTQPVVKDEVSY